MGKMNQSNKRLNRGYLKRKGSLNKINDRVRHEKERNLLKLIPKLRKIKGE